MSTSVIAVRRFRRLNGVAALVLVLALGALALAPASATADSVTFGAPSPAGACVTVPVNITRTAATAARSISVTIQLSADLVLCSPTPTVSITRGTWLDGFGSGVPFYFVLDQGAGKYQIDQSVAGTPCGPTGNGTLFNVSVKAASGAVTSGTISILSTPSAVDCTGGGFTPSAGSPVTLTFPSGALGPITGFTATRVPTGNDADGTAKTRFEFTLPAGATAAEIYAAPFGNYPEFDDPTSTGPVRKINFQPSATTVPVGFEGDFGLVYTAARGYGWNAPVPTTNRNLNPGNPNDTFAFAFNSDPAATWEIDVAPGSVHQVRVVCGDPSNQQRANVVVEGVTFLTNILTNGGVYTEATHSVTVADGKLTVQIGGAAGGSPPLSHTKIDFIEVGGVATGPGGSLPPVVGSFPPPARYTLLGTPATSPAFLESTVRDYYSFVAFAVSGGTRSAPVATASGLLNYHLGDVYPACSGDNVIDVHDLSLFAANYGLTIPNGDSRGCLDFCPVGTTDPSKGLSQTDNVIDFQDLNCLATNYGAVSKAVIRPLPMSTNLLSLEAVEQDGVHLVRADVRMQGDGTVRTASVKLAWNGRVVEPIDVAIGDFLDAQGGIALQPCPGSVDFAILGTAEVGFLGDGLAASVRFRRLTPGDPGLAIEQVRAIDLQGATAAVQIAVGRDQSTAPRPRTALVGNIPNPFNPSTKISFSVAARETVRISIYGLDGRLVKHLVHGELDAGSHEVTWDGADDRGARVASGVYYARLATQEGTLSRPLVLVK